MKNPRACDYCKEYRVRCVRLNDKTCKECRGNQMKCQFNILPKKRGPKPKSTLRESQSIDLFVNYTSAEIVTMANPDPIEECLCLLEQKFSDPNLLIPIKEILLNIRNTSNINPFWKRLPNDIVSLLRGADQNIINTLILVLAALGHTMTRHPSSVIFYDAALDAAQFLLATNVNLPIIPTLLNACYDQLKTNHMA